MFAIFSLTKYKGSIDPICQNGAVSPKHTDMIMDAHRFHHRAS